MAVPFSPAYEENWVRPGRAAASQTDQQAQDKSQGQEFFSWEERHGQKRVNENATVRTAPSAGRRAPCPRFEAPGKEAPNGNSVWTRRGQVGSCMKEGW